MTVNDELTETEGPSVKSSLYTVWALSSLSATLAVCYPNQSGRVYGFNLSNSTVSQELTGAESMHLPTAPCVCHACLTFVLQHSNKQFSLASVIGAEKAQEGFWTPDCLSKDTVLCFKLCPKGEELCSPCECRPIKSPESQLGTQSELAGTSM